MVFRVWSKAP